MIDLSQTTQHSTQQAPFHVASPQLVAANHILSLSSAELQKAITQEADENPALEVEEATICPRCGRALHGTVCLHCATPDADDFAASREDFSDDSALWQYPSAAADDPDFDPTTRVPAFTSLREHLLLALQAQLPAADEPIAEYLVGNLDDNGRLCCSDEEVVDLLGVSRQRVERAIRLLQAMEPVGIGARDVRECLLIQLAYVEQSGKYQPGTREIIERFLPQLSEHKYGQIAAALNITTECVHAVSDFIKKNLNPYPARGYVGSQIADSADRSVQVLPDVIITRKELADGQHVYEIEVVESKRFTLRLNQSYAQLYADVHVRRSSLSESERRHIQQYVSRAKLFIANINQRRHTLMRITRCLVDLQRAFLDGGIRQLQPLTRARVASELSMHESTVSRATAAKYVMLPTGEVIPFSHFFVANLSIKDVMKDLIGNESTPLTDQELAASLDERGIRIARRTVAKYREQLGILPSSMR